MPPRRPTRPAASPRRSSILSLRGNGSRRIVLAPRWRLERCQQCDAHCMCAARAISAFEPLVTFAVVAASLFYPSQASVAVGRLVGPILVEAGMHAGLARRFVGIFRRDRLWEPRA